jgi:tetratricopeptide (TPR) repeat protein
MNTCIVSVLEYTFLRSMGLDMDAIPTTSAEACLPKVYDLVMLNKLTEAIQIIESTDGLDELCEKAPYANTNPWQNFMGFKYYKQGDPWSAITWFEKAAEQGDVYALYGIGMSHFVLKEYSQAIHYLQKASEAGHAFSSYLLGSLYLEGIAVEKDENLLKKWFRHAASNGILAAELRLARYNIAYGTFFSRTLAVFKVIFVYFKVVFIAIKNSDDLRLLGLAPPEEYKFKQREPKPDTESIHKDIP